MPPSTLFAQIEAIQGSTALGNVLDAGTGARSLRWLTSRATDSIAAVTGARGMAAHIQAALGDWQRPQDRLLVGNWADPELLRDERFDTVLADHLLGALEGFAPFFQEELLARLRALTGRRLYITGMEPYVVDRPRDAAGALLFEIGRFRDCCLLLAGQRPFREYPLGWVLKALQRAGFTPVAVRKVVARYGPDFVHAQIGQCSAPLQRLADRPLAEALLAHGDALRRRALDHVAAAGALRHDFHYVVAADPA